MSYISDSEGKKRQSIFFLIFCFVVLINPVPLGSNRTWAWSFEGMVLSALLILMVTCSLFSNKCISWSSLKMMKLELKLISAWFVVNLLYLIPLPLTVVQLLSPSVAEYYTDSGAEYGYLTLDVYASFKILLLSVYYLLVFILGTLLINSRKRIKLILYLFLILGVLESIYGMYLVSLNRTGTLIQVTTVTPHNASGTFINKNHLVAFLSLCFICGLMLRKILIRNLSDNYLEDSKMKLIRFISSPIRLLDFCMFLILAGIWNTHSRAGLASFMLSIVFLYFFVYFSRKNRSINIKRIIPFFILGIVFLVLVADDLNYLIKVLGGHEDNSVEYVMDSAEGRVLAVNQFLHNIPNYWFSGVGPGAYQVFFVNHRTIEQTAFFDHAHNDYIEFMVEYGIMSVVLLVLLLVFFYRIVTFIFKVDSRFYKIIGIGSISCVIYMLLHGTMDFNARIPANVFTIIVVISAIYGKIVMLKLKKS